MVVFALPFIGGSAISYFEWEWPDSIDFVPIDYSGHGLRRKTPLLNSLDAVALDVAEQISNYLLKKDSPNDFVILGHSFGGIVAWYCSTILESRYGLYPDKVVVSSCNPPDSYSDLSVWDESTILQTLISGGQLSESDISSEFFRNKMFPVIVHDYKLLHSKIPMRDKVKAPILVLFGSEDALLDENSLGNWRRYSCHSVFDIVKFDSGHFYLKNSENYKKIINMISENQY